MVRKLSIVAIALAMFFCCSDDDDNGNGNGAGFHDVTLNLTGMDPHVGKLMGFYVKDAATDSILADTIIDSVTSPDFSVTFDEVTEEGKDYLIGIFGDLNMNGRYDPPPTDHAWELEFAADDSDGVAAFAHTDSGIMDIDFPNVLHDLTMLFTGMTPHLDQNLSIFIKDRAYGTVIKDTTLVVPEDSFQLSFGDQLVNVRDYDVDFFVDFNENGTYDAPPVDHAWRRTVDSASAGTVIQFVHDTVFTDIQAE